MENKNCVHILVEGLVQGVGFRYYVKSVAQDLGVTGWVRNRYDERVEIHALGDTEKLQKLIALVRAGPSASLVTDLTIEWQVPETHFERFSIAPTV